MSDSVDQDVAAVARIGAVRTILKTVRESTGLRFTVVSRVLPDRWVACAVHDEIRFGLAAGDELDVDTTLCREVRESRQPILIEHASQDDLYRSHRTPKLYGFESYVAVPIYRRSGEYFGNVSGFDPEPRALKDGKTLAMLELFSELISHQLETEALHEADRVQLARERADAMLREQFLAVLGHDVRNPLSSIVTGTELLLAKSPSDGDRRTLERIRRSSKRIASLVDDLLDLARGRLGGGIAVERSDAPNLAERLGHVVAEMRAAHPTHAIELVNAIQHPVRCDERRIEQLLSNLIANAIEHGTRGAPIAVELTTNERALGVRVQNHGPDIPQHLQKRLFQPFLRGEVSRREGLGLGLYIVSEVVKSHGGTVEVESRDGRTAFSVELPRS